MSNREELEARIATLEKLIGANEGRVKEIVDEVLLRRLDLSRAEVKSLRDENHLMAAALKRIVQGSGALEDGPVDLYGAREIARAALKKAGR